MGKRDDRRRKTLARMVRLKGLETANAARHSADLVAAQTRLTSLSDRSKSVIAAQSQQRSQASATDLRQEYNFTRSLSELDRNSSDQARELDPQITAAVTAHGQSKHREERLRDRLGELTRRAKLRANHGIEPQSAKLARKLNSDEQAGGRSTGQRGIAR